MITPCSAVLTKGPDPSRPTWATLAYRVAAIDNGGTQGPFVTSDIFTVQDGMLYIIGPNPAMGLQTNSFILYFGVGVTGATEKVRNISVAAYLDRTLIYSSHTTSISPYDPLPKDLPIDVRVLAPGAHNLEIRAERINYTPTSQYYSFIVPDIDITDEGGIATQLQDETGTVVLPVTTAGLVVGLKGQNVGANLFELFEEIQNLKNAIAKGLALYKEGLEND